MITGEVGQISLVYSDHKIFIRSILIDPHHSGHNLARRVVYSLLSDPEVRELQLYAARSEYHNGYAYWAEAGFNSRLPAEFLRTHKDDVRDCKTVQDIMHLPNGSKWWHLYGVPFYGVLSAQDYRTLSEIGGVQNVPA